MIVHLGYIDPGSGSIFLQAVMGGVIGGAYVVRKSVGQFVGSIKRVGRSAEGGSQTSDVGAAEEEL